MLRKGCPNIEVNLRGCPCTYPCDVKGKCCECIRNHRSSGEIPGCFFPTEVERTYDRSIRRFVSLHK